MVAKNTAAAMDRSRKPAEHGRRLASVDGGNTDDLDSDSAASPGGSAKAARRPGLIPPELDRLIHERMRLGIVSALAVNESLSFTEIKELMRTTDGNLSVHARKLEEAKYVSCSKSFEGRVPHTVYKLTSTGRRALERYLNHMESIIRVTRER
jgi:DNA-binding transcriptional ArsR family regulator